MVKQADIDIFHIIMGCGCSAAIFDLDGVVTDTAKLHAHAWKVTLDKWMKFYQLKNKSHATIMPFDVVKDYNNHMSGRERLDGIRVFLDSRGVKLPLRDESNTLFTSISGLGEYKNNIYIKDLETSEIKIYHDAVGFIERLRQAGLSIALATSSKNSPIILEKTGLNSTFDVIVDGNHVELLSIPSKPKPDIFMYAANQLGFSLDDCVVFEDSHEALTSISAVSTACVIGVAKNENELHRFENMPVITKFNYEDIS